MGLIVNPRGTSGSGKTEFARRILAEYGWSNDGRVEPIHREGRGWPIGYRLLHPLGRRPLVVLGHYERTSGGCDTISARDGGLDETFRLADAWASTGHDVLFEGAALSAEHERSASLARRHALHVLCLATPREQAARNLVARRRTRRDGWPSVTKALVLQHGAVEDACRRLRHIAVVKDLAFGDALCLARELLGLGPTEAGTELRDPARRVGAAQAPGTPSPVPALPAPADEAQMRHDIASPAPRGRWMAPDTGRRRANPDTKDLA